MVYVDNDIESNLKYKPKSKSPISFYQIMVILNKYKKIFIVLISIAFLSLFTNIPLIPHFRLAGPKVVIVLGANEGGGVLNWKGAQEWSIERSSIANKKDYAERHGYGLAVKDLTMKKRYSHEWRESWEKVDLLKQAFRQYPNAEWFWWLDLHTYIMEPQKSLEELVLNNIDNVTERQVFDYNPLRIAADIPFIDYSNTPVEMVISQDCNGFNLGSFLIKKSDWSQALLDTWWDPVWYEQMHMHWVHKEQDALQNLYQKQAWIRERVAFVPQRKFNSFPPGACSEQSNNPRFFYSEKDRDFLVNMAGCNWGRDCWTEMERYKSLSKRLHKPWYKFW